MLEVGEKAPDFNLPDQNNQSVRLSDFAGKWVVLYFYPKAMTGGCTTETQNFRDTQADLQSMDAVVLGISKDSVTRQKKFADKEKVNFSLLSDEYSDVCERYGVWQQKKMYGKEYMGIARSTFIIDPQGQIAKVYPKVKVKEHHTQVLQDLQELGS
ncbi:MAG: thioredoxin-dependent thiol peroxidase [Caldithrix sp.]|nr:thioredoxin-dependent thiol peroxidase [Caldithrix sp.]